MADTADAAETKKKKGHGGLIVVIICAIIAVAVLVSAYVWPGWAVRQMQQSTVTSQSDADRTVATPKTSVTALPQNATTLEKAMPDAVGAYARKTMTDSSNWASSSPLEEHTVIYSTGDASKDVTLVFAQWSKADSAKAQYDALAAKLDGSRIASGTVKVSGQATGDYTVVTQKSDSKKAIALWRNDTCVFEVTGPTDSVKTFYKQFPL